MRFQKRTSVGQFLQKGKDVKDGDIVIIANEGQQVEGQFGTQDIFLIELSDGRKGNVAFNRTSINNLIDGYGEESQKWIGKQVKVFAIKQNVQGKITTVYYFLHPESELDEESGEFIISNKSKEEIPVVENEYDEVNKQTQVLADQYDSTQSDHQEQ